MGHEYVINSGAISESRKQLCTQREIGFGFTQGPTNAGQTPQFWLPKMIETVTIGSPLIMHRWLRFELEFGLRGIRGRISQKDIDDILPVAEREKLLRRVVGGNGPEYTGDMKSVLTKFEERLKPEKTKYPLLVVYYIMIRWGMNSVSWESVG